MYLNEKTIKLATNPKNVGVIEGKDVYSSKIVNPICNDITVFYTQIKGNEIIDAKFKTFGCFATIASASALTVIVKGNSIENLLQGKNEEEIVEKIIDSIIQQTGKLPEQKWHCIPASLHALFQNIETYYKKDDKSEVKKIEKLLKIIPDYYKKEKMRSFWRKRGREENEYIQ